MASTEGEHKERMSGRATRANAGEPDVQRRERLLMEVGYNPLELAAEHVEFDLKTDSWAQLSLPAIARRARALHDRLQRPLDVASVLRQVFPYRYVLLTDSGRSAEHVFYKAFARKGAVLQNLLFPTNIFHQIDKGFEPIELPDSAAFDLHASGPFKGDLALPAVRQKLEHAAARCALACAELSSNAAGGSPVSMQHVRELKALVAAHSVPLMLDVTRVVENARFVIEHEAGFSQRDTWSVVRELHSHADIVIGSLTKDFCVARGGIVATNDAELFQRLEPIAFEEGCRLDAVDSRLIGCSLADPRQIEAQVMTRMNHVRQLWAALHACGVPVAAPAGAHCVLIDVKRIERLRDVELPVASFLASLYRETGIRAAAHSAGMQRNTALNDLVRLAVPIGLTATDMDRIVARLKAFFERATDCPELVRDPACRGSFGDVHARYLQKRDHTAADPIAASTWIASGVASSAPSPDREGLSMPTTTPHSESGGARRPLDIAVVGMAGRYPHARNVRELWTNLAQGKDSIVDLPDDRYARRLRYGPAKKYRGGFIDDIDKFDPLFFNIAPKDAENTDPQLRLFLEVAWETLEDAGYFPESLARDEKRRNVGVFVGAVWAMYQMIGVEEKHLGFNKHPNSFLWGIANRVSYWMNLSGPSITLDTACSSSLTALYLACEAIAAGDCSSAIVGGVNLDLHQSKWDINSAGGALSKDGVCRSFGRGANGYVAGEGIGAIFIKPLSRAIEDGDYVYGVIKSVTVNHGGRTSGYMVPNPKAQAELIRAALDRAEVDARTIGFVEAHGTGTELGDPLEVAGLRTAFEKDEVAPQSCAIGSIKTNIGHLEAAAGVVGVTKVLLQMQHRKLVPSLHSQTLNEFIDFNGTPFYVQQQLEDWHPKQIDGLQHPLRAGISSFGAGGANAHVILEAYDNVQAPTEASEPKAREQDRVFPLSARNEEQLRETALRLRDFIAAGHLLQWHESTRMRDLAHTLQVGRKAFDCRLAVVAKTEAELITKLSDFLAEREGDGIVTGNVKNAEPVTRLLTRKERGELVEMLGKRRDAAGIARLWVNGVIPDWRPINDGTAGRKLPLPTYPFADKRYWATDEEPPAVGTSASMAAIHPLLDANDSTFERQLFRKRFHERDFFIYDHIVGDVPTLPGVAYLELARRAGEIAAGRPVRKIRNVLWVKPIMVENGAPLDALVELQPRGDVVNFEVFSLGPTGEKVPHSQGSLVFATKRDLAAAPEYIDVDAIRGRCEKVLEGSDAYPLFKSVGLNLGPSFQVLKEVYRNEQETLGSLELPEMRRADLEHLMLHPSLMDGSLQAGVAAGLGARTGEMLVPFSIGEVEILHPLETACLSYVTDAKDAMKENSRVSKRNVLILDRSGKVLVRIKESTGVPLSDVVKKNTGNDRGASRLYYSYIWEPVPAEPHLPGSQLPAVLLFDTDDGLRDAYRERLRRAGSASDRIVRVRPGASYRHVSDTEYEIDPREPNDFAQVVETVRSRQGIDQVCFAWPMRSTDVDPSQETLDKGVYSLLFLCQALIRHKLEKAVQLLYVYPADASGTRPHDEAVNGFLKTLRLEHGKVQCRALEIPIADATPDRLLDVLLAEYDARTTDAVAVRYSEGGRSVRKLASESIDSVDASTSFVAKEGGVYLITGGAGGLGLIFARFLASQGRVKLVLTGRSNASPELDAKLEPLRALGADVMYVAADVSDRDAVQAVVAEARARFGAINGVIHSAGVLRDSYVRNKTRQEMQTVLAPKILGTTHLDDATRDDPLDFFVLFSSLASIAGNAGQCDYAFANHFMDSFAARREHSRASGGRRGRTLSINWSLWADGGMKVDAQTEQLFVKTMGVRLLSVETGVEAFVKGLASAKTQLAVIEGDRDKIETLWGLRKKTPPPAAAAPAAGAEESKAEAGAEGDLITMVRNELSQLVMKMLKLDASETATDAILLDLGFDSIGLTTFANELNGKYEADVTPVLFFDYPSIDQIAGYLCKERRQDVLRFHRASGDAKAVAATTTAPGQAQLEASDSPTLPFGKGWTAPVEEREVAGAARVASLNPSQRFIDKPIAIVGMSGVLPQSDDVDQFWEGLAAERNLVTVIPPDRWKWEDYYGDPFKEANKSNSKWGGFMKEVDKFDPLFFGISRREAQMMDPQQRLFLETVWKAIEDSGHKVSDLSGTRTGLFVGVATNDYSEVLKRSPSGLDGYTASGNSHSVLANRVSFLLNLRGPSAPIDTACSSSLIALHRAIESIHTGSCDMAIVGGVQVMLGPAAYISFSRAGMLSGDGRCKAFDKRADGYVRGEGVGAVLLKSLEAAEADGDHIYAVIRSTAENHGGKVTTLTAPNSAAQAELVVEAYEKARIDPATVGYIECHGTGTGIGDPIEVQALTKAFGELYRRHNRAPAQTPHCGLSSVKTNIGHLETAAGIAAVIKVLLALRHKQIPANLHFEELNPYINLKGSPFYVVDKTSQWQAPSIDGTTLPRRAGVSSFGFGGANAHVVLEEYTAEQSVTMHAASDDVGPQLVVLSAKSEDRLVAYAQSLLARLDKKEADLIDIAYTLQVGRDEMSQRLAIVTSSLDELRKKLRAFVQGGETRGLYRGEAKSRKDTTRSDDVDALIERGELSRLAELWVGGATITWQKLARPRTPRRLSLPTYPFARERCWISDEGESGLRKTGVATLHPLVHQNVSTLKAQKFSSRFVGKTLRFSEYLADTRPWLACAAYLEMARAAGELADDEKVRSVRNLVVDEPLAIGADPVDLELSLVPSRSCVSFSARSVSGAAPRDLCSAEFVYATSPAGIETLSIEAIRQRCSQRSLAGSDLHALVSETAPTGADSAHIVQRVEMGVSECLVTLDVPANVRDEVGELSLHPALVGGLLRAGSAVLKSNGLVVDGSCCIGEVESIASLRDVRYGFINWSTSEAGDAGVDVTANLLFMDEHGRLLVRVKDLATRARLDADRKRTMHDVTPDSNLTFYRNVWREAALPVPDAQPPLPANVLLLAHSDAARAVLAESLATRGGGSTRIVLVKPAASYAELDNDAFEVDPRNEAHYRQLSSALALRGFSPECVVHLWSTLDFASDGDALQSSLEKGVYSLLHTVKGLTEQTATSSAAGRRSKVKIAFVHPSAPSNPQPQHSAIAAFAKCLALESSRFTCKTIEVETSDGADALFSSAVTDRLLDELQEDSIGSVQVRYRADKRSLRGVEEFEPVGTSEVRLKERGVYLITGGIGGLGSLFARHLAERARARLVLTGRSVLDDAGERKLEELRALGAEVLYVQADIARCSDVDRVLDTIKEHFGALNGIVHAAGVLRDAVIQRKTAEEMTAVFAAKIHGTVHLDDATRRSALDFFAVFSSMTAITGNAGQSDYAYANSFLDHFVERRNMLASRGERSGLSLALDWPLWESGGMRADERVTAFLKETAGIEPLDTASGLDAFARALAGGCEQMLVMKGNPDKIRKMLLDAPKPAAKASDTRQAPESGADAGAVTGPSDRELHMLLQRELLGLVAKIAMVAEHEVSLDTNIGDYGMDSINLAEMVRRINERYTLQLRAAIFFEHPSLSALTQYLIDEHRAEVSKRFGASSVPVAPVIATIPAARATIPAAHNRFAGAAADASAVPTRQRSRDGDEVAVVGISGIFPQCESATAFWQRILNGDDLITEIPSDRWDWRAYEGDPLEQKNTTNSKWGGFMRDVDKFDAAFFGISPAEARMMDPQQRLFLEMAWKAIEDAGERPSALAGTRTGVYVGVGGFEYVELLRNAHAEVVSYAATGMAACVLPNRVSYLLDLHGPSEPVDTACSSSLVAVHRAVEAIASGACDMAIAGGVNVLLSPALYVALGNAGMLANDGRCKSFDGRADGYVRGEGCGAVFLKPLKRALADGNPIYGVVKGSGVNHGGRAMSLTAPNPNAQSDLLIDVYQRAGVDPRTVSYIEAHGTGTALGDAVEINALKRAFREIGRSAPAVGESAHDAWCGLGSVKTNVGHLEAASGITSFIKVLLALKHKRLPGNPHYREPSPHIQLDGSPFRIVKDACDWAALEDGRGRALPRTAGVSSFGFGGVNAHVIVQEYSRPNEVAIVDADDSPKRAYAIPLSARSADRLVQVARDLLTHVRHESNFTSDSLASIAYTLQVGRDARQERMALLVGSTQELIEKLEAYVNGDAGICGSYRGRADRDAESIGPINRDAEIRDAIVARWIARGDLGSLLAMWAKGLDVDWSQLYGEAKPRRVSLPSYPFARERHWVETADHTPREPLSSISTAGEAERATGAHHRQGRHSTTQHIATASALLSPVERIQRVLEDVVALQLRANPHEVPSDKSFLELGLGSLGIAQLVQTVNGLLDAQLSPSLLFQYPSISRLAAFLAETYPDQIRSLAPNVRIALVPSSDRNGARQSDDPVPNVSIERLLERVRWNASASDASYETTTF